MIIIEKKPKEPLGIITALIPNETGVSLKEFCKFILFSQYRIVGVELDTPGHRELKKGNIKLLDRITQLNEGDILSGEWFEQSTRDVTRLMLTLWRNTKPPNVDKLLSRGNIYTNQFVCINNSIFYSEGERYAGYSYQTGHESLCTPHWK